MKTSTSFIEISDQAALASTPLVSVHMLAYNHAAFIGRAIEGVLAQQVDFPIELIIAEDCSPDRTREIALSYQKNHPNIIRVLTGEKNVGMLANAARFAVANRGKYIAPCEGDDCWHHPLKLQMQVQMMEADSRMALCHTDFDRLIGRRRKPAHHTSARTPWLASGEDAYAKLLHERTVITATSMYRADVVRAFTASPFNRPDWPFGDYNLVLFASAAGPVGYIPVSTAAWRKVYGSATNSGYRKILRLRLADVECRQQFMSSYPVPGKVRQSVLQVAYGVVMRDAFYAGDLPQYQDAARNFREAGGRPGRFKHWLRVFSIRAVVPHLAILTFKQAVLFVTTRWF